MTFVSRINDICHWPNRLQHAHLLYVPKLRTIMEHDFC